MGTLINMAAIAAGCAVGILFRHLVTERIKDAAMFSVGLSLLVIGGCGVFVNFISLQDGVLHSGSSVFVVLSLTIGGVLGEILQIEEHLGKIGRFLEKFIGNKKQDDFITGFVTSSVAVSVGAMSVLGPINEVLLGDTSLLLTKAIIDFIMVSIFSVSFGIGCAMSIVPLGIVQGCMMLLATFIEPYLTDTALSNLSMVGSVLIFCIGINFVWKLNIKVSNLLPAIVVAMGFTYFL